MSFFQSEDQIINILKQCFTKADKFQIVENATNEGHMHYISDIIRLTFKYEEDGIPKTKSLVLKVPTNGDASYLADELNIFDRENFVYDTIIPRINDYLDEPLTPFYIKTADSRIIMLENLVAQGYEKGQNDRLLYNQKQSRPIIKALAYFHAASHKVAQLEPHLLHHKMFQSSILFEMRQNTTDFWEPILFELLARNNASYLISKLKNVTFRLKNDDGNTSSLHHSNFNFCVLNHGDFRKDNVMLKYGPDNEVDGVKIIDFQTCFWSTPINDFVYFFLMSTETEQIENHYEACVNWYLEFLNEKLRNINCTQAYNRQNFEDDIRRLNVCSVFCIMWTIFRMTPLDELGRARLLDEIVQGKKENIRHYTETFLKDELLTKKVLGVLKLCEKLQLFEPACTEENN